MSTTTSLDADFDMIDWLYGGLESVLCDRPNFKAMTGNESYYCYHFDVWNGMEAEMRSTTVKSETKTTSSGKSTSTETKSSSASASSNNDSSSNKTGSTGKNMQKYIDSVKKVAANLYKNLMDMLKRIRDYFFGEGEQAAVDASKAAVEAVQAMDGLSANAPIPDDAAARDPNTYLKGLEGGAEYQELLKENPDLNTAIESLKSSVQKLSNSATVGKLRLGYADVIKNANAGIQTVGNSLRKVLSQAEKKTQELKNPKLPKDGETTEVKEGIKAENSAAINEAKEQTKKARLIGGVRNKIVATLLALDAQSKTVKDKPPQSKFKG